ncbi:MAG: RNA polymerase-binding protein DksA [Desulfococcaceae bacterium]|jgi:DnaK suppressor protein|nr:RNA polymerase-binding protein DksA [Desulfococcaceae bacterium]
MEKKEVEYFREILLEQLKMLLGKADESVSDLMMLSDDSADPLDHTSNDMARGYTLRMRDRENRLIGKIHQALRNIEDGSYGICEMCEEEIGIERLKVRPVARYCIQCKQKNEAYEKTYGL